MMADSATMIEGHAVDLIDATRLESWLAGHVEGDPPVRLERIGTDTGVGNAMFLVGWGDRELVLRRPPATRVTPSAANVGREARLLGALAATDVRHPRLVAYCDDDVVLGSAFILMERVDGFTPVDPLPRPFDQDMAVRRGLGAEVVDALAELAVVDWQAIGLDGFGKPDGFLARQVDRWLWQLGTYRTRPLADLDELTDWLRDHLPPPGPIGIMHGDYSLFNVMFSPRTPAHLAAIVDWDTATIGEPLMDLGHLLSRWDEPGEEPTALGTADLADRTGLLTRAELADRYSARTGVPLTDLRYYEVLSLFKLGCIMEGHYARQVEAGVTEGGRFADTAPKILRDAARIARGERS